jgi:hypothetical protein
MNRRQNLEETHPKIVDDLVNDLAKALHHGRTTPGETQTNDGWPYRDQVTMKQYPQLKEIGRKDTGLNHEMQITN